MSLVWAVCAAFHAAVLGDTTLVDPNGTQFRFGEWSRPAVLALNSDTGLAGVVSRSCGVTIGRSGQRLDRRLDLLYYAPGNEVWMGESGGRYVVFGSKIWAFMASGTALQLSKSQPAGDSSNGQDVNVEKALKDFVSNPTGFGERNPGAKAIPLTRIFGVSALFGTDGGSQPRPYLEIREVTAGSDGVTVSLKALRSHSVLSLTLDGKSTVTEARRGGKALPFLFNNGDLDPDTQRWAPPVDVTIPSAEGSVPGLLFQRNYTALDATTNVITLGSADAVVEVSTGELWLGPSDCRVVLLGKRIVGIRVEPRKRELQLFAGRGLRLPVAGDASSPFREHLKQFDAQVAASNVGFQADQAVSLSALFAADSRFAADGSFTMRKIGLADNALVVVLDSDNPQAYPEIRLSPDFRVLSTRVLPVGSPEFDTR